MHLFFNSLSSVNSSLVEHLCYYTVWSSFFIMRCTCYLLTNDIYSSKLVDEFDTIVQYFTSTTVRVVDIDTTHCVVKKELQYFPCNTPYSKI